MVEHKIFGIEGRDGTGKSTVGLLVANETGSNYYAWRNGELSKINKIFDKVSPFTRFLYYVSVATETALRARELSKSADTFVDRTMVSTIAYHRAMGVPKSWIALIPKSTLNQIDTLLYFTADDQTRSDRMQKRLLNEGTKINFNDTFSLKFSERIHSEYLHVIPDRTKIFDTSNRPPEEIAEEVERTIYGK